MQMRKYLASDMVPGAAHKNGSIIDQTSITITNSL